MVINIHSFISACESEERGHGEGGGVYAPLESDTPRNVVVNRSFCFPFQVCTVKVCVYKHLREDLVIPRKTKVPGDGVSVTKKLGHPPLSDTTRPKMKSSTLIEPQSLLSVSQVRSFLPLSFPSFLPSFHSLPSLPLIALSRGPGPDRSLPGFARDRRTRWREACCNVVIEVLFV